MPFLFQPLDYGSYTRIPLLQNILHLLPFLPPIRVGRLCFCTATCTGKAMCSCTGTTSGSSAAGSKMGSPICMSSSSSMISTTGATCSYTGTASSSSMISSTGTIGSSTENRGKSFFIFAVFCVLRPYPFDTVKVCNVLTPMQILNFKKL